MWFTGNPERGESARASYVWIQRALMKFSIDWTSGIEWEIVIYCVPKDAYLKQ